MPDKRKMWLHAAINPKTLLFFFMFAAAVIVLIVSVLPNNDTVSINSERSKPYNTGWLLENESTIIQLPHFAKTKANDVVVISKTLTDLSHSDSIAISFISSLQSVKIEVGDKIIYEYCQNPDVYFDVQPPPAWHIVRLSRDMEGQTLRITFSSPFDNYAGVLNSIEIGTKYANVISFLRSRLVSLALCFTIFVFGVFVVVIYLFSRNKIPELSKFLYLGLASILVSLWSACETKAMQIFTGNVQLIMFVTFLSIMLFPIAFLLFFRESFSGRIKATANVFLALFSFYFIAVVSMQVFSIANLNDYFVYFLAAIAAMLIFIFVSVIYMFMKNKSTQTAIPVIAVTFVLVFALIDMYRYLFGQLILTSYSDTSLYVRVGILLMIFTLGYSSVKQMFVYYTESTKTTIYKTLSQTDPLTGLKNRAYVVEMYPKIFDDSIRNKYYFSVILLDIDNFKNYNDHYGHSAGDVVIASVARALQSAVCRPLDVAVRYGGEEFLVLLPLSDRDGALFVADKIKNTITELGMTHEYNTAAQIVTVSQGVCSAIPVQGDTLELFIDRADQALYEVKKSNKNGYAFYEAE